MPLRFAALFVLCPALLSLASMAAPRPAEPAPFHPHFPKQLTCRVTEDLTVAVGYQTVTFNAEAAAKLAPGKAWHLAGATFETSADLVVGGRKVPAGKYALSTRKSDAGGWELVLHEGRGFSTKIGDDARVLDVEFADDAPLQEHLNIDVQPGGDKDHTTLWLEVRFDRLSARARIEIPE